MSNATTGHPRSTKAGRQADGNQDGQRTIWLPLLAILWRTVGSALIHRRFLLPVHAGRTHGGNEATD